MRWCTDPWQCTPIPTEDNVHFNYPYFHIICLDEGGLGGGGNTKTIWIEELGGGGGAAHMGVQTKGFTLFSQFPKERPSEIRKSTGAEKSVLQRKVNTAKYDNDVCMCNNLFTDVVSKSLVTLM